jgi:uncharacterized membrane protein
MDAGTVTKAVPPLRSWRERAMQSLAYEIVGLIVIAPLWSIGSGATATQSITLLVCLSAAVVCWTAAYNTAFDLAESRLTRRVASDRRIGWRIIHAAGLEFGSVVATCPLIMLVAGMGWLEALGADLSLSIAYAGYGYMFHLAFDRLGRVGPARRLPTGSPVMLAEGPDLVGYLPVGLGKLPGSGVGRSRLLCSILRQPQRP